MKIKKITITGMHKIDKKTYDLNDSVTYFVGQNGAGKSTILEAIQLAILGYIPGYAKTNESIMKHASGPVMAVVAELDSGIKITRIWTKTGSTVSAKMSVEGYDGEISDLVKDIELPIFNFNEFKSMTSNKLKEWFISFLPSSAGGLNLEQELKKEAQTRSIPFDDVLNRAKAWLAGQSTTGIELVKDLNTYFKTEQSFVKGQIAKLQGTVESLVRYDEAEDLDEDSINEQLKVQQALLSELITYEAKESMKRQYEDSIQSLKSSLPAASFEEDSRIAELNKTTAEFNKKADVLEADSDDIQKALLELSNKRSAIPSAEPICPYTKEVCETASKLSDKFKAEAEEIDKQIAFKKEEAKDCNPLKIGSLRRSAQDAQNCINSIKAQYDRLNYLELQVPDIGERPTTLTRSDIESQIAEGRTQLTMIAANKKYDELASMVTKDKFNFENELEILKLWIKLTDANGLQSKLMDKPFEDLADDMSKYLTAMFNEPTEAKFNLVSKANSFSFGLTRSGQYIEFDYLSSGERCLFTLALVMCILDKSQSEIRTIIIDDILDHLDSANATHLFTALKNVENVQFILAGVKECEDESICKAV